MTKEHIRTPVALGPWRFGGPPLIAVVFAVAMCTSGCEVEDAPPPEPVVEVEGRRSTLGRAMDAAERTRDRVDDYNEAVERAADDIDP